MNRYVISGATADAQTGKSVVISCRRARDYLDEIAKASGVVKVRRANGQERVDFQSGGSVELASTGRYRLRGRSVDVVFVDHDATVELTEDAAMTVISKGGEVIRA